MKRIEAILRPESVDPVIDALKLAGAPGVTVMEVEGHGNQKGVTQNWRGQEYKVDLLPKVKVDVIVANDVAAQMVDVIIKAAKTGKIGDGKIFVTDVTEAVRIRTGQRGNDAL